MARSNLGKVNLETCWPAVYHVGRPTRSQGPLAVPAMPFSRMTAYQSTLLLPPPPPPPLPLVHMFLAAIQWFSNATGAMVSGGHWVAMDTPRWVGTPFGGPSITRHQPLRSSVDEFNPFTPKNDKFQISPAAPPEILRHTV